MVCGSVSKISTERTRTDAGRFTLRVRTDTRRVRGKSLVMDRRGHRQPTDTRTDYSAGLALISQTHDTLAKNLSAVDQLLIDSFQMYVLEMGTNPKFGFMFASDSSLIRVPVLFGFEYF